MATVVSQTQPHTHMRSRSKSTFGFTSNRSSKSNRSVPKMDLKETTREKLAKRLSSKADPLVAMSETEPGKFSITSWFIFIIPWRDLLCLGICLCWRLVSTVIAVAAIGEHSELGSLSGVQHKDIYGNMIGMYLEIEWICVMWLLTACSWAGPL